MSAPSKKQRTHPQYELLYHPGIPGRAEFIRLAFEAASVPYTDVANESKNGYSTVQQICMNSKDESSDGNPPVFSPPALGVPGAGKDGGALVIHQTPNILLYLGPKIGLTPEDEAGKLYVNQITLTALDLNNEIHDTHHPVAGELNQSISQYTHTSQD
jgi:glutathione S-transferase